MIPDFSKILILNLKFNLSKHFSKSIYVYLHLNLNSSWCKFFSQYLIKTTNPIPLLIFNFSFVYPIFIQLISYPILRLLPPFLYICAVMFFRQPMFATKVF